VTDRTVIFPVPDDPNCLHRSHYACSSCEKIFCARCGVELAETTGHWLTLGTRGFRCEGCR
jgi:DNA-directed RNA polymerase subunit RPC12/RpoP